MADPTSSSSTTNAESSVAVGNALNSRGTSGPTTTPRPAEVAATARRAAGPTSVSRIPFFASAAQPEIVRANQKDQYYLSQLTERIEDVARSLLGTRWLQVWNQELQQGSKLAYFGLTTLLGSQTLGEEYCDILQYDVKTRKPPSQRKRGVLISLHIIFPYIIARIYSAARRRLIARHELVLLKRSQESSIDELFSAGDAPPPLKKPFPRRILDSFAALAPDLPSFESLREDYLRSVHLAIFYLFGRYYNLSKRGAGIRFISTQARPINQGQNSGPIPTSYEVLGFLMAIQIGVRTLIAIRRRRAMQSSQTTSTSSIGQEVKENLPKGATLTKEKKVFFVDGRPLSSLIFDPDDPEQASPYPEEEEGPDARDKRCTLCLGTRRDPAATECGHVFCWECVVGWAREKPECPLCRQSISLPKLLPLYNL